eukprot:SAG11_NODE_25349_length_360_cov_0.586207_2_plen_51_part_01
MSSYWNYTRPITREENLPHPPANMRFVETPAARVCATAVRPKNLSHLNDSL